MTTAIATADHAKPSAAIARPGTARPRASAYQMPKPATTSPISSFDAAAGTAHNAKATSRALSRNQNAYNRRGGARTTGWNSFSVSQPVAGYRRYASAKPSAARGEP